MAGRGRRVLAAAFVVCAIVACGLDRGGDLSTVGPPIRDSSTDSIDPNNPPDGSSGDAPIDSNVDARPTDLGDCQLVACQSGNDPFCSDETCDSPSWNPTATNGGSTSNSGGDCYTKTTAGGSALYERSLDQHDSYFYELRYLVRIAAATTSTIGEIGPVGKAVRLDVDGTNLRACMGVSCTPNTTVPIATAFVARVFGQMGKTRAIGSLVLSIDCVEKASINLVGPFLGTTEKVRARVGCLAATTECNLLLDDIVFRVAPN